MFDKEQLKKLLTFVIQAAIAALLVRYGVMPPPGGLGGPPQPIVPNVNVQPPVISLPDLPPVHITVPPPTVITPPVPTPPTRKANPQAANVKLFGPNYMCSATIVGAQAEDGSYLVLTAGHCAKQVGQKLAFQLLDGRRFWAFTVVRDDRSDLAWLRVPPTEEEYPYAELASGLPSKGTAVWHEGYGVNRPHNHETGVVVNPSRADGQIQFDMLFSAGDSGAGIFDGSGRLVGVVSSTAQQGFRTAAFGGSCESAKRLLESRSGVIPGIPNCPSGACPTK